MSPERKQIRSWWAEVGLAAIPPGSFAGAASVTGVAGALVVAAVVTVAVGGVAVLVLRSVRPIIGACVGIGVSAFFALRSGDARDYFLPDLWYPPVVAGALVVSTVIGRPLVGVIYSLARRQPMTWRRDRLSRWLTKLLTLAAAAGFLVRFVIQFVIYRHGDVGWLAVGRVATGLPLTGGILTLIAWGLRVVDRREQQIRAADRSSLSG